MSNQNKQGRWVAIITGAFSIFIALIYLVLVSILDSRGPMLPPPPEALIVGVIGAFDSFAKDLQPLIVQFL